MPLGILLHAYELHTCNSRIPADFSSAELFIVGK